MLRTTHCAVITGTLIGTFGCSESSDPTGPGGVAGGLSTSSTTSQYFGGTTSSTKTSGTVTQGGTSGSKTGANGGTQSSSASTSLGGVTSGGSGGSTAPSSSVGGVTNGGTTNNASSVANGGAQSGAAGTRTSAGAGGVAGSSPGAVPTCPAPAGAELTEANVPAGYCAWTFAEGLDDPRGMIADAQGQLLVVERGRGQVTLLWDENGDRINQNTERMQLAATSGLNHGIALHAGYLYASTSTTVYRWAYDGSRRALSDRQTVLTGMPSGGHSTRTLIFDGQGNLYIAIGSGSNLDANSNRARVVRLDAAKVTAGGASLIDATLHADGTRNEVALRFDSQGRLWGVENGSDDLNRSDLGGDIHNDNPAEELNLLNRPGAFYGYPYCWSEGNLPASVGLGSGTQWAYPSVMNDGVHTDAWCRNTDNVQPPVLTLQAHTAPLDILFYQGGSFPESVRGNAIVTYHGSWNRTPATGYKVVMIPFGADGMPTGAAVTPLLESQGSGDTGGGWTHRPVALAQGKSGEVYVTSDEDGVIMAIGHE